MAFQHLYLPLQAPAPQPPQPLQPPPPPPPPRPDTFSLQDQLFFTNFTNQTETLISTFGIETSPFRCPLSIKIYGDEYRAYRYAIEVYFLPFVIAFGLIGNTVSFSILGGMKQVPATVVLRTLAITDSIYLINCLFFQTLETLYTYDDGFAKAFWFYPYIKARVVWPLANTIQTVGIWLILLVTSERFYAITRPLVARGVLTKRRNRVWIFTIFFVAFLFNAPCHLELRVADLPVDKCQDLRPIQAMPVSLISDYYYNLFYKTIACLACKSIGPVFLLCILNGKLVREIHKSRSDILTDKHQSATTKSAHHMTEIVAIVVGTFIICQIPDTSFRIIRTIKMYNSYVVMDWKYFAYMATISNMFLTINSSINFLLYCVSGRKFRQILSRKFSRCRRDLKSKNGFVQSQTKSTELSASSTARKPPGQL